MAHQDTYNYEWALKQNGITDPGQVWQIENARKWGNLGVLPTWMQALVARNLALVNAANGTNLTSLAGTGGSWPAHGSPSGSPATGPVASPIPPPTGPPGPPVPNRDYGTSFGASALPGYVDPFAAANASAPRTTSSYAPLAAALGSRPTPAAGPLGAALVTPRRRRAGATYRGF